MMPFGFEIGGSFLNVGAFDQWVHDALVKGPSQITKTHFKGQYKAEQFRSWTVNNHDTLLGYRMDRALSFEMSEWAVTLCPMTSQIIILSRHRELTVVPLISTNQN